MKMGTMTSSDSGDQPTGDQRDVIAELKDKFIEMIDQGCTRFGWSVGPRWHDMTLEEKAKTILDVWNAPRAVSSQPPVTGKRAVSLHTLIAQLNKDELVDHQSGAASSAVDSAADGPQCSK